MEGFDPYLFDEDGTPKNITLTRSDGTDVTLTLELICNMIDGREEVTVLTPMTIRTVLKEWLETVAGPRNPTA